MQKGKQKYVVVKFKTCQDQMGVLIFIFTPGQYTLKPIFLFTEYNQSKVKTKQSFRCTCRIRPVQSLAPIRAPIRAYMALKTNSVVEVIRALRCTLDQNYHQTVSRIRDQFVFSPNETLLMKYFFHTNETISTNEYFYNLCTNFHLQDSFHQQV